MKNAMPSVPLLVVLTLLPLISGCEESNLTSQRQVRLMGDENIKLKTRLKLCNRDIQRKKDLLVECEKDLQDDSLKQPEEATATLMQMLGDIDNKIRELKEENQQLRNKIQGLESRLAQNGSESDAK
jgi:chromosome segregation ATPase